MPRTRKVPTPDSRVAEAWRTIAMTEHGRLALAELFLSLNLYSEIPGSDPITAGIAIGERNVAVRIAAWCGRKPETFMADAAEDVDLVDAMSENLMEKYTHV
jgi:hypothetical protein